MYLGRENSCQHPSKPRHTRDDLQVCFGLTDPRTIKSRRESPKPHKRQRCNKTKKTFYCSSATTDDVPTLLDPSPQHLFLVRGHETGETKEIVSTEEERSIRQYVHHITSTKVNGTNELWYSITTSRPTQRVHGRYRRYDTYTRRENKNKQTQEYEEGNEKKSKIT